MRKISAMLVAFMLLTNIWSEGTAFGAEVASPEENTATAVVEENQIETVEEAVAEQEISTETSIVIEVQPDNQIVVEESSVQSEPEAEPAQGTHQYIGHFTITHYCICSRCCGKSASNPAYGITATGTLATPERTIAVDPRVIPYGTQVIINDHIYIAEDCGGAIKQNRIDVLVTSHSEALKKGILRNIPVYVVM